MTKAEKPRKPRAKSVHNAGGQTGNKNALRHGFYSKTFSSEEKKRLDLTASIDIESEIALIRICLDKLKDQISFEEVIRKDDKGNETRDNHYIQQLNTLAIMTQSISTLVRTHYLIKGKSGDIQDTILHALEELRLEMGI